MDPQLIYIDMAVRQTWAIKTKETITFPEHFIPQTKINIIDTMMTMT